MFLLSQRKGRISPILFEQFFNVFLCRRHGAPARLHKNTALKRSFSSLALHVLVTFPARLGVALFLPVTSGRVTVFPFRPGQVVTRGQTPVARVGGLAPANAGTFPVTPIVKGLAPAVVVPRLVGLASAVAGTETPGEPGAVALAPGLFPDTTPAAAPDAVAGRVTVPRRTGPDVAGVAVAEGVIPRRVGAPAQVADVTARRVILATAVDAVVPTPVTARPARPPAAVGHTRPVVVAGRLVLL